jgi:arylsulfatase A-like enzyme
MEHFLNRRDFLKTSGLLAAAAAIPGGCGRTSDPQEKPNVILILTDDQGYGDVGIRGNDLINTPYIDRFAREGIDFARFYTSPVCAPTRASLLTGRYYYRTGIIHTYRGGTKMHGDEVTIAERLSESGYATGIFGKWHLGDNYPMRPREQGFNESLVHKAGGISQTPDRPNSYFDPLLWHNDIRVETSGYCTDIFTNAAIRFIESNRQRPFFVYLATNAPHTPLEIAPQYSEPYKAMGLSDTTARIYGMITNIDENVGRLLARLDSLNLRDNTIVIFMSDNGPQQPRFNAGLRGLKASVYEGGIRVPFFIRWPDGLSGGRKTDRIAAHIDIHPTILDACGLNPRKRQALDGISLLSLLDGGEEIQPERKLFFQCHRGLEPKPYQNCAVVTQRYKAVGYPNSFSKANFIAPKNPVLKLYDLKSDPSEQNDLAESHPEILASLKAAYDSWYIDVKNTRQFTPELIIIGSESENPVHLCRDQDATYVDGAPVGWAVDIKQSGSYEITIDRGEDKSKTRLHVKIGSTETIRPLGSGRNSAIFHLPAGATNLDIWTQDEGKPRVFHTDRETRGDVTVQLMKTTG